MRFAVLSSLALAAMTGGLGAARAAEPPLVVAELFTSQSCSSCPPAEALFKELSGRPGVLTLEWHVDYWDDLYAGSGPWKDPYSNNAYTLRQRDYNQRIRGQGDVYTPQAVIGGAAETVGSDRRAIDRLLGASRRENAVAIDFAPDASGVNVNVRGAPQNAEVLLVRFRDGAVTKVRGGENEGRTLASAHLVVGAERHAAGAFRMTKPAAGDSCAVLVQNGHAGPILAAARCPA